MSFLLQLQTECADRLRADPLFEFVPVITEVKHDVAQQVEAAMGPHLSMGGKGGVCAVVLTPIANASWPNVAGPFFDEVKVAVIVRENPPINRSSKGTGHTAADLIERVCQLFNLDFKPTNANSPLRPDKPTITLFAEPEFLTYHAAFVTSGGTLTVLDQVATPLIVSAGDVTITCATADSFIFYTLNGKNPAPLTGTRYLAPFSVAPGTTVKARAFLPGMLTSETAKITT